MSNPDYIKDLLSLTLAELQAKYMKPKDQRSLTALRRYYNKKQRKEPLMPEAGPEMFISQAKPTVIRATTRRAPNRKDEMTLCMGDAQIGYRGDEPFHDERVMELAQLAIRELQPDRVVFTGDMIDLPNMSRFEQRSDWANSTQRSIDRYHAFLAQTRANAPNAEIAVVHGNHEARMDRFIRNDAAALLNIKRANSDRELSVLTLQYLVRYDELGVQSVDGYPNAAYWLEDNIKVMHGTNVAKAGSNVAKYLREETETVIFGHTHRLEHGFRTLATRIGGKTIQAASPGCLSRVDGAVPGYGYSVDNENRMVPKHQDWQNGLIIVTHNPRVHDIDLVHINEGGMTIHGKHYE